MFSSSEGAGPARQSRFSGRSVASGRSRDGLAELKRKTVLIGGPDAVR